MNLFQKIMPARGSVLIFSLVILSFMLISALSIAAVSVSEKKSSFSTEKSSRSFQVADSGVEIILQKIYKGGFDSSPLSALGSCSNGEISATLNSSTYKISFYDNSDIRLTSCSDTSWRSKVVKIKSEGLSGNTTRAVEVAVAAAASGGIGQGQTWQDVTTSRVLNTSYQNSTSTPIMINVTQSASNSHDLWVSVDNSTWVKVAGSGTSNSGMSVIVPVGHWYKATGSSILSWAELR